MSGVRVVPLFTALSLAGAASAAVPVDVRSQAVRVDSASCVTAFSGDAVLTRGDRRLHADLIEVYHAKRAGTCGEQLRAVARGHLRVVAGKDEITGPKRAVLDLRHGDLSMDGSEIAVRPAR